jgi:hypothetical protein
MSAAVVRDARPPAPLVRALNPILRLVLRTPLGRLVRPFALLELEGRRTGRRLRVPVGWYQLDSGPVVVSPAPWRASFRGGWPATVWFHGRRQQLVGVLDTDPERVAATVRAIAVARGSLGLVGIAVPPDHEVTAADVVALDRAVIRFGPPG